MMKYTELINRKIAIRSTDPEFMKQVYNFMRYKQFDKGHQWIEGMSGGIFGINMAMYLQNKVMNITTIGTCRGDNFDEITDVDFLESNKLTLIEKIGKKPFGYIE